MKVKQKKHHKLFVIREPRCAQRLLNAAWLFKDIVFERMVLMNDIDDVFGADVSRHNICLSRYFHRYNSTMAVIMENQQKENSTFKQLSTVISVLSNVLSGITFDKTGCSLSYLRDEMNRSLPSHDPVSNYIVKELIIDKFGDKVCFSYPSNNRISQMAYLSNISCRSLINTLRHSCDKQCADDLRKEMKEFSFGLKDSYCKADDLDKAKLFFEEKRPPKWILFMKHFFQGREVSENNPQLLMHIDAVFQVLYYILHSGIEPTPLHVALG